MLKILYFLGLRILNNVEFHAAIFHRIYFKIKQPNNFLNLTIQPFRILGIKDLVLLNVSVKIQKRIHQMILCATALDSLTKR